MFHTDLSRNNKLLSVSKLGKGILKFIYSTGKQVVGSDITWTSTQRYFDQEEPTAGSISFFQPGPGNGQSIAATEISEANPVEFNGVSMTTIADVVTFMTESFAEDGNTFTPLEPVNPFEPVAPDSTVITSPIIGATNVSVRPNIVWTSVPKADGYRIKIGTSAGGDQLLAETTVTENNYRPATDFSENTVIHVSVTAFNDVGDAAPAVTSFTTMSLSVGTTAFTAPANNATGVSRTPTITWSAAARATGYKLSLGTTAGGTQILNNVDLVDTTYTVTTALAEDTVIHASVTPYNDYGDGTQVRRSFTTEVVSVGVTAFTAPAQGATGVILRPTITWSAAPRATGYYLSLGSSVGGTQFLNNSTVTGTSYTPATDLPGLTLIHATLTPFNALGNGAVVDRSFTTESDLPGITSITAPTNGASNTSVTPTINWTTSTKSTGYKLAVGSTAGGTEYVNQSNAQGTSFAITTALPEASIVHIRLTPFNALGDGTPVNSSFTTETLSVGTTTISSPTDGEIDVDLEAVITWTAADRATSYEVTLGTTAGASDLLMEAAATGVTLTSPTLPEGTEVFLSVTPINSHGRGATVSSSFTTLIVEP